MRFPMLVALALAACGGGGPDDTPDTTDTGPTGTDTGPTGTDTGPTAEGLALIGTWVDEWGTTHTIDEQTWSQAWYGGSDPAVFALSDWSNAEGWVIAENVEGAYFLGAWSRFDWTEAGGDLFYCQTAYDAPDEAAARATPAADPTDPTTGGCGGFPWTNLTP